MFLFDNYEKHFFEQYLHFKKSSYSCHSLRNLHSAIFLLWSASNHRFLSDPISKKWAKRNSSVNSIQLHTCAWRTQFLRYWFVKRIESSIMASCYILLIIYKMWLVRSIQDSNCFPHKSLCCHGRRKMKKVKTKAIFRCHEKRKYYIKYKGGGPSSLKEYKKWYMISAFNINRHTKRFYPERIFSY